MSMLKQQKKKLESYFILSRTKNAKVNGIRKCLFSFELYVLSCQMLIQVIFEEEVKSESFS